jgi:hypothetical protein
MASFRGCAATDRSSNTVDTALRNLSDAGLEEKRIMDISGHKTRLMFDRYNIGRKGGMDKAREAIERFHRAN